MRRDAKDDRVASEFSVKDQQEGANDGEQSFLSLELGAAQGVVEKKDREGDVMGL